MRRVNFSVKESTAEALRRQAEAEHRSVSNLIDVILKEYLELKVKHENKGDEYMSKHQKSAQQCGFMDGLR